MKELFEREMLDRFDKAMEGYAGIDPEYSVRVKNELSDSNAGAVYKLRAVKDDSGKWIASIHCGITGGLRWEDNMDYNTPDMTLTVCLLHIKKEVRQLQLPEEFDEEYPVELENGSSS